MNRLTARLAKLENGQGGRRDALPVAVVESPFPAGDPTEWARSLITELGGAVAVWVVEGNERKVLLPPTNAMSEVAMPPNSEAERLWGRGWNTYPHYMILGGNPLGAMLVERFESAEHERQRTMELEAEAGGVG